MTIAINRKHDCDFLDVSEPRGQCGLSGMRPESEPEALKPEISGGKSESSWSDLSNIQGASWNLCVGEWVRGYKIFCKPYFWSKVPNHILAEDPPPSAGLTCARGEGPKPPDHLVKLKCWWQSMTRFKTQGSESFLPMDRPAAWRLCPRTLRWISHNCQTCRKTARHVTRHYCQTCNKDSCQTREKTLLPDMLVKLLFTDPVFQSTTHP